MMRQKPFVLLLILGLLLSANYGSLAARGAPEYAGPDPIVETGENVLHLTWRAPKPEIEMLSDNTVRVTTPGYSTTDQSGMPRIPMVSTLIALSPYGDPALRIDTISEQDLHLPGSLEVAPAPDSGMTDGDGNAIRTPSELLEVTPTMYEPVSLEVLGILRGVRLARLSFYPVRPAAGQDPANTQYVKVVDEIDVTVILGSSARSAEPVDTNDPILSTVREYVLNPAQLTIGDKSSTRSIPSRQSWDPESTFIVEVNQPGLTAITYQQLANAGFPVNDANPKNIHLNRDGVEIAVQWDGDADTDFSAGERILFYADTRFSRWTWNDAYYLWEDNTTGLRMASRPANPDVMPAGSVWQTAVQEENNIYTPELYRGILVPAGRDGDRWVWDELDPVIQPTASYPINLPTIDATQPATLTVWLISSTDVPTTTDHRVDVAMNGTWLHRAEWNGKQAIELTLPLPAGLLENGSNTLGLELPGIPGVTEEKVWLDAFQIEYARGGLVVDQSSTFYGEVVTSTYSLRLASTTGLRGYQITEPDHPVRLTGLTVSGFQITLSDPVDAASQRYHISAESGIKTPAKIRPVVQTLTGGVNGANYLLISPEEFIPGLDRLIDARENKGLWVEVEDVQAIYDNFGDGRTDPEAIRNYLAYVYANWAPIPNFVVLVGDGTFDPKQYRNNSWETFIPPYLAIVDSWAGETAADNRYVAVDGSDNLPDMLIGRLPVNSLLETESIASKITHYELVPPLGDWTLKTVFVADNPDEAGDFITETESFITKYISPPYQVQRVFYTPPMKTVLDTRQEVMDNWNYGAGFMLFNGHSSIHFWAAEQLLHLNNISSIHNSGRQPILIESTCFTSSFHVPGYATLDEELVRYTGGGAVATWGSTGLGLNTGHYSLVTGFMNYVFLDGNMELGPATLSGKLELMVNNPAYSNLVDVYTLLGDPATELRISPDLVRYGMFLPSVYR